MSSPASDIKVESICLLRLNAIHLNLSTKIDGPSVNFSTKYPTWGLVDNKLVAVLEVLSGLIKFQVVGDPASCWATARPEFFQLQDALTLSEEPATRCQCDVWITGCKCGIFKNEQKSK